VKPFSIHLPELAAILGSLLAIYTVQAMSMHLFVLRLADSLPIAKPFVKAQSWIRVNAASFDTSALSLPETAGRRDGSYGSIKLGSKLSCHSGFDKDRFHGQIK
jgi:hypothetical protein